MFAACLWSDFKSNRSSVIRFDQTANSTTAINNAFIWQIIWIYLICSLGIKPQDPEIVSIKLYQVSYRIGGLCGMNFSLPLLQNSVPLLPAAERKWTMQIFSSSPLWISSARLVRVVCQHLIAFVAAGKRNVFFIADKYNQKHKR